MAWSLHAHIHISIQTESQRPHWEKLNYKKKDYFYCKQYRIIISYLIFFKPQKWKSTWCSENMSTFDCWTTKLPKPQQQRSKPPYHALWSRSKHCAPPTFIKKRWCCILVSLSVLHKRHCVYPPCTSQEM